MGSFPSTRDRSAWMRYAYGVVRNYAETHRAFVCDDLWEVLTYPKDPRWLGNVINQARQNHLIQHSRTYVESHRRNGSAVPVWRSLVGPA